MTQKLLFSALAALLFAHGAALAQTPGNTGSAATGRDPELIAVQKNLRLMYPKTRFDRVRPTPLPGVYEVVMGRNVAFVEGSGRYFIFGRLFDMEAQEDITSVPEGGVPRTAATVDFGLLPLDSAIRTVKGKGSRVLAVFSDPDCPYCKKLEQALEKVDDVTVYTFLMPLEQLHPEARAKADGVWCANDRAAAWKALMTTGKQPPPPARGCEAPHAVVMPLAEKLGISGTPFLVAGDGRTMPGAVSSDRLDAWLDKQAATGGGQ
ncbi:DsbC family protein [Betaproteobacteria bacterium SCN1]|jgi:thiol:disulfide interchange protein DsbC|nr:DsbC family protein [Betaproteobacteria bacterium SCN1]